MPEGNYGSLFSMLSPPQLSAEWPQEDGYFWGWGEKSILHPDPHSKGKLAHPLDSHHPPNPRHAGNSLSRGLCTTVRNVIGTQGLRSREYYRGSSGRVGLAVWDKGKFKSSFWHSLALISCTHHTGQLRWIERAISSDKTSSRSSCMHKYQVVKVTSFQWCYTIFLDLRIGPQLGGQPT